MQSTQVNVLTEEGEKFKENNRVLKENTEQLEATNNQVSRIRSHLSHTWLVYTSRSQNVDNTEKLEASGH